MLSTSLFKKLRPLWTIIGVVVILAVAWWFYDNYATSVPGGGAGIFTLAMAGLALLVWIFRDMETAPKAPEQPDEEPLSGNFGTASFMSPGGGPRGDPSTGVFFGKMASPDYEVDGGPIYSRPESHSIIFAKTRAGKGTRIIVPTLLKYGLGKKPMSVICLDPKGELSAITARARAQHQHVHVINPWNELASTFAVKPWTLGTSTASLTGCWLVEREVAAPSRFKLSLLPSPARLAFVGALAPSGILGRYATDAGEIGGSARPCDLRHMGLAAQNIRALQPMLVASFSAPASGDAGRPWTAPLTATDRSYRMTTSPEYIEIDVELTEEEHEQVTAKAKAVGIDVETYFKVRALSVDQLPEPAAFFALYGRLASFAKHYKACLKAFADQDPKAMERIPELADVFAQLLQDWGALYGPRPEDQQQLPELIESTVGELPPRNEAEAEQRARQAANADAFFENFELPPGTDRAAIRKILDRQNQLTQAHDEFFRDIALTGVIDRPKLAKILADVREARREFLIALGKDPDSEDLLPLTATLHDA